MKERTVGHQQLQQEFCDDGLPRGQHCSAESPVGAGGEKHQRQRGLYTAPAPSQRAALHALRRRKELAGADRAGIFRAHGLWRTTHPGAAGVHAQPGGGRHLPVPRCGADFSQGLQAPRPVSVFWKKPMCWCCPAQAFGDAGEGYLRRRTPSRGVGQNGGGLRPHGADAAMLQGR